ncbi:MAG: hypothetical protein WC288_01390 [Candidatus Paceibacterota bacterium]|jgi:hypothetical protein|nr:hypothetical protein [Candidatus Paceibacterota bacterium]MDD3548822.1 hypothetical protein [Candidatus Paceibacterota bacterium]
MDKNKKFLIIAGILLVFLVVFLGVNEYQKQQKEFDEETALPLERYYLLSGEKPENQSDIEKLELLVSAHLVKLPSDKDSDEKAVICKMAPLEKDSFIFYYPQCYKFSNAELTKGDEYLAIGASLNNLLLNFDKTYSQEREYYFCSISYPSWIDPLVISLYPDQELSFSEGNISCSPALTMDKNQNVLWFGTIPQADSLSLEVYLVGEDKRNEILSSRSFQEAQDILNKEQLIWQREKPILNK